MTLRQLLNVTYAWLVEGRDENGRETVDNWLAGKPLPPQLPPGAQMGTVDDLIAMAKLGVRHG
ncbi:MAG: hypothetical protein KY447_09420 [Actinobacteria bacterium]|nr:hypothetical protein [Actinomycetota bacterium]